MLVRVEAENTLAWDLGRCHTCVSLWIYLGLNELVGPFLLRLGPCSLEWIGADLSLLDTQ